MRKLKLHTYHVITAHFSFCSDYRFSNFSYSASSSATASPSASSSSAFHFAFSSVYSIAFASHVSSFSTSDEELRNVHFTTDDLQLMFYKLMWESKRKLHELAPNNNFSYMNSHCLIFCFRYSSPIKQSHHRLKSFLFFEFLFGENYKPFLLMKLFNLFG